MYPRGGYQDLVAVGLVSHMFFSIALIAVGFLLYSDLVHINRVKEKLVSVVRSSWYSLLLFALAVSTVLATIFGAQVKKAAALESFLLHYPDFNNSVLLHIPYLQLGLFLLLSGAVFISNTDRGKVVFIALSWLVISLVTVFRIEWGVYLYVVDAYILLSALLVWSLVSPGSATHRGHGASG